MHIENSLGYLLNVSARLIKQHLDMSLAKYEITTSQWAIMKILSEQEELTQVEIARLLHSDKATCGTVLEKLRKQNLIEKNPHPNDKRAYCITLTKRAKDMIEDISLEAQKSNHLIERNFDKDEIKQMKQFLSIIIHDLGGLK